MIDLGGIPDIQGVRRVGDALWIGAMTTHQTVADDATVQAAIPGLAVLAGGIGDRQVRAMGTIGGSIANNDPAACYPSALMALGATVHTNQRELTASDFFQGFFNRCITAFFAVYFISFNPRNINFV